MTAYSNSGSQTVTRVAQVDAHDSDIDNFAIQLQPVAEWQNASASKPRMIRMLERTRTATAV